MIDLLVLLLTAALAAQIPSPDSGAGSGAALRYKAWCAQCHGLEGRGDALRQTHLAVRPANLADCRVSSAETEDGWTEIVRQGGAAFGLSLDMPAFESGASPEQLRAIVRYIRSLCKESGWPPGELNFPRAFLAEKAYPENEVVVVTHGVAQQYIYERRVGRRAQLEASARTVFDSLDRPFDGVTGALKYTVWYSAERRALATLGVEATPPVGRQDLWEIEPFLAFGANPLPALFVQGELIGAWEATAGVTGFSYSLGLSTPVSRFVPMLEVGGTVPRGGETTVSLIPQMWVRLSRLGHVAGSLGVEVPVRGPAPRDVRLTGFLLWDFGDAGLFRGW